ncbi:MAG: ABC transporter permease, partial [Actinomycetota bacterium]|nr:ABC transporter permease [Actinomycetota bacterium]
MLRTTLKGLLAQRLRLLLTALAVVLGVGFLTATSVLSDSIRKGADGVFGVTAERSDAEVRSAPAFAGATGPGAAREPMPQDVVNRIKAVDGVDEVAGLVQGYAQLLDKDGDKVGSVTTAAVGGSAAGLGTVSPFELSSGRAPQGGGEVVVDVATLRDAGLAVGDEVTILFTGPARKFRVVGAVTFGGKADVGGSTFALFDLPTAQEVLDRQGRLDDVVVSAKDGVTPDELVRRLDAALPDTLEVTTSAARADERSEMARQGLSIVNTSLTAFALISLGVGSFIILNTFTIVVTQRTRELALLRALGASRKQVRRSVLVEAAVVGLMASVVGALIGVGLAVGLRSVVESFGLELPGSGLVVKPRSLWLPVVIGLVITSLAAYLPARRAG